MLSDLSIALRNLRALMARGELESAGRATIALYDRTVSLDALQIALDAGNRARNQGDFRLAIRTFTEILERDPNQHEARCHLGMSQLATGHYADGWTNYDARPMRRGFSKDMRRLRPDLPLWDGNFAAIAGKTLLVMAEQGFGDAIQFARYVPLLRDRGIEVVLGCRPPLAKLLATLPEFGADCIMQPGQKTPPVDAYTLLMSLPGHFKTTVQSVPTNIPYLLPGSLSLAGRELIAASARESALRVAIVWAGSATREGDGDRSCGFDALLPLLDLPNVTFFSAQKDPNPRDRQRFPSFGLVDLDPFLLDFTDTAAFLQEMDLVISVDTAVVHLAGALGKPVWVALEAVGDWRWLGDRDDSPWYPSVRLFRQSQPGDWASVVAAMRQALDQRVRTRNPTTASEIEPQSQLQAAIVAFQNQDFETADRLCHQLQARSLSIAERTQLCVLQGSIAYRRHDLQRAIEHFRQAIVIDPQSIAAQLNLGNCYRDLNQINAALPCYARAEAIAPPGSLDRLNLRWERSLALLQAGRWREGFAEYEARLDRQPWPPHIDRQMPTFWDGRSLRDRTLLLRISQGFGDVIQMMRYVPWLQEWGIRVAIESRPPLTRLLRTLPGVSAIVNVGDSLPPLDVRHDRQALCLSLPHLCKTTIDTIPGNVPYLRSPGWHSPATRATVEAQLNSAAYKVGVVWSGSPTHGQDFRRSIPFETFAALLDTRRRDDRPVQFYSLQPKIRDSDRTPFDRCCETGQLINLGQLVSDFGDTAYLIERLDAVVAVDTSIVHLAGALAKPTWVLLSAAPDWRWLRDRPDTPWYPTLKLVRQKQLGNWHSVLAQVRRAIENKPKPQTPPQRTGAAFIEF